MKFPKNSEKPLFNCKKFVINTKKCDQSLFLQCVVRWSENSVSFENSYGNWLLDGPDGPNSVGFYLTVRDMARIGYPGG